MTFDPKRSLVMATFKTVLGHNLPAGTPLTVVEDPSGRGEIDEALATRLLDSSIAVYADEHRPTPVETPEQEKARLAALALREATGDAPLATSDLTVWQEDDAETGKRKGQKVTKDDLLAIAAREGVTVEGDDTKPDVARKIVEHRAASVESNQTNAGTDTALGQDADGEQGSTGPDDAGDADGGLGDGEATE